MRRYLIIIFITCSCILQGQVWYNVIDSLPNLATPIFHTTEIDSNNNILYIGGQFNQINQFVTNNIIKYDGINFDTLGSAIDDQFPYGSGIVASLKMFQNKLYVGGLFTKAGNYYCKNLSRWNGVSWDTVNFKPNAMVRNMTVYNNELYVCGSFDTIGGIVAHGVAKYDGINWFPLSFSQSQTSIEDIAVFQDTVYAEGGGISGIGSLAKWNGTNWVKWKTVTGDGFSGPFGLTVIDSMIFVYGRFDDIANTHCKGLAAFNGKKWFGYGTGVNDSSWERIQNIQKANGDLYITGLFDKIEGVGSADFINSQYTGLAKFDGQKWCVQSPTFANETRGVVWYKNNLYCHGTFQKIGADSVYGFVKWIGGTTTIACSPTITLTQTVESINEITLNDNIIIFPNPTTSIINIVDENNQLQNSTIQIKNNLGQLVFSSPFNSQIDMRNLSAGIYFLIIKDKAIRKTIKIIRE